MNGAESKASTAVFTVKELECLARHLQEYVDRVHYHEEDAPNACAVCSMAADCYQNGVSGYWFNAFNRLSKVSGVDVLLGTTAEQAQLKG